MRTAWGYDVSDNLAPIISVSEFNQMTGGAYSSNPRVEAALKAASQAIRNHCGWHVCPSMSCTANPVGGAVVARLPATYVSAISSITENDTTLASTEYEWRKDGLIKRVWPDKWNDAWGGLEVEYTAGYSVDAVPDLAEAVCSITAGVLAVSAGVNSESADGVSISYSSSASSIAAGLTSQQKSALEPYRVVDSHAA